jgi:microcystin-dependent protein
MPSTYTTNGGIELPANGEQSGTWGSTVNDNMNIVDRLTNGVGGISLSGTTHTLTTADGTLSDGHYSVLVLGGAPSGTNTITIAPNDGQHVYIVKNSSGQSAIFTQGSGGNVTVLNGKSAIIYSDGAGSGAAVVDITSTFQFGAVDINGGTIDGTVIGGTTAAAGTFTTGNFVDVVASGTVTAADVVASGTVTAADVVASGTVTAADVVASGTVTAVSFSGSGSALTGLFASGMIMLWSGSVVSIPSGWLLCNGTSGTPDLRNRFVVGAGDTYAVDATGGAATVTLDATQIPAHSHTADGNLTAASAGAHTHTGSTNTTGAHTHNIFTDSSGDGDDPKFVGAGNVNGPYNTITNGMSSAGDHSHTFTTDSNGAHTHDITGSTSSVGGGLAHENLPPYYALAYIMKS